MKGWKVKIPELERYEKLGFSFYEDVDFLFVYYNSEPKPIGIFNKHTTKKHISSFLEGYIKGKTICDYIDEGVDLL